ncbi:MAG TPA: hypothetical protein VFD92_11110 [Candidatus Binatia bacterium]|nr:hypothetical protein [Candidatus Binatia bacterium]
MPARTRIAPCRVGGALAVALALVAASATQTLAIKWNAGCIAPSGKLIKASPSLYVRSRFIHPGHEIGYFLRAGDAERNGGFSTEPDGNLIEIWFVPRSGVPIALPPFRATAVSATALYFDFPDPQALVGRTLVGNIAVRISTGGRVLDRINRPVVLPPANDVVDLVEHGTAAQLATAVDAVGNMWIPVHFSRFGSADPMPFCPAPITPKMAFAVGVSVSNGDPNVIPYTSFAQIRNSRVFLGDFAIDGQNVYGEPLDITLDVRPLRGGGLALCAMNDAIDLVIMLPLKWGATLRGSPVLPLIRDGSPYVIHLRDVSADPVVAAGLHTIRTDGFGSACVDRP